MLRVSSPHMYFLYIKTPYLEKLGKDVPASFSHGAYFVYSKMLTDRKEKARGIFQENTSVFLKGSKIPHTAEAYVFQGK